MAEYNIEFVDSAAKEFRALPIGIKHRVQSAIDSLHNNPFPARVRKLTGHKSLYRIRIGQYRVVYDIDDQQKLIRVTRIRHRREVYR